MAEKSDKTFENVLNGIDLLKKERLYKESTMLLWKILRGKIFSMLYENSLEFSSTEMALLLAMNLQNERNLKSELYHLYMFGLMAEWDENFHLSEEQFSYYENSFKNQIKNIA